MYMYYLLIALIYHYMKFRLLLQFWLNNPHQANVNQNEGGNTANPTPYTPDNSGTNFWAVQIAPGVQQPVPLCIDTATCGVMPIVGKCISY